MKETIAISKHYNSFIRHIFSLLPALVVATCIPQVAAETRFNELDDAVYATVASEILKLDEYKSALHLAVRQKFYHGKIPKEEIESLRRSVGKDLITRTLLLQEAVRQGVDPDEKQVNEAISKYDQRYASSEQWQKRRDKVIPQLTSHYKAESRLDRLKAAVQQVTQPTEQQLKAYYDKHPEKFTRPERLRISVILLKIDPSSPAAVWDAAREEAGRLYKQIKDGADFAELASMHSSDVSAEKGGDMGYLHKGMLAPKAQKAIDEMKPGEVSKPVSLLQGVAIFRLDEFQPAKLNDFTSVRKRVRGLWLRQQGEDAWQALIDHLWEKTAIAVNKKHSPVL